MLSDLHLLHHLPQRSTITGAVLADHADLLCALGLFQLKKHDLLRRSLRKFAIFVDLTILAALRREQLTEKEAARCKQGARG